MDIMAVMNRGRSFWYGRGLNDKSVGEYLKELKKARKDLNDIDYGIMNLIEPPKEHLDSLCTVLDDEIKYCKFYFEYNRKARKDNFNQWTFFKEEDRQKRYDLCKPQGDCWVIGNGRMKATINIKDSVTTKIWLELENDSEHLEFYHRDREKAEKCIKHLRKKESIEQHINDLKIHVERTVFQKHLYPLTYYTRKKYNMELLEKLPWDVTSGRVVERTRF